MSKVKVLVIEDLVFAQLAAYEIFQDLECDSTIVQTGAEALDEIIMESYDIVFMDLQLPDLDGFELITTIRLLERTTHLPIIAVTANYFENMAQICKDKGFDGSLLKPLTVDSVRSMLETHLRRLSNVSTEA